MSSDMSTAKLAKESLMSLASLALRPDPFDAVVGWNVKPAGIKLRRGPVQAAYLGLIEWAWSPVHSRLDAYYLSRSRSHWILWVKWFCDNSGDWNWLAVGYVALAQASQIQAATHLLADFWRMERAATELDHFHWIGDAGLLDAGQWQDIALLVWPDLAAAQAGRGSQSRGHDGE